jgi:prepilin-type processing-associated H-X9-DG protein
MKKLMLVVLIALCLSGLANATCSQLSNFTVSDFNPSSSGGVFFKITPPSGCVVNVLTYQFTLAGTGSANIGFFDGNTCTGTALNYVNYGPGSYSITLPASATISIKGSVDTQMDFCTAGTSGSSIGATVSGKYQ